MNNLRAEGRDEGSGDREAVVGRLNNARRIMVDRHDQWPIQRMVAVVHDDGELGACQLILSAP